MGKHKTTQLSKLFIFDRNTGYHITLGKNLIRNNCRNKMYK